MFLKLIYPLSLREKLSYKFDQIFSPTLNGKDRSLCFNNLVMDLNPKDVGHRQIILNGFYELGLTSRIQSLAKQGGVLVDVGSNYGYFSILWAGAKPGNKSYAFEASPLNLESLRNNVKKNKLQEQIDIIPVALGNQEGKIKFNLQDSEGQTGWGGITITNDENFIEVPITTLNGFVAQNKIDTIDVLKIDTEGADTWVIYGAEKLIKNKRVKNIFWEENLSRMEKLNIKQNESHDFLNKYGYKIEKIDDNEYWATIRY